MNNPIIQTPRLDLVLLTIPLCIADLSSSQSLAALLDAYVPDSWPPELMDAEAYQTFLALLQRPEGSGLYAFYWIERGSSSFPGGILIGSGGFLLQGATPELGYSVLPEYQRRGYATEAVSGMISWFVHEFHAPVIRATTFPDLVGSIAVLERNGFVCIGPSGEEGAILYEKNL